MTLMQWSTKGLPHETYPTDPVQSVTKTFIYRRNQKTISKEEKLLLFIECLTNTLFLDYSFYQFASELYRTLLLLSGCS
jgi:hypothetical protein